MTKKWVLGLLCNRGFWEKAIYTINGARTVGKWRDDIILLTDFPLSSSEEETLNDYDVIHKLVPPISVETVNIMWEFHKDHPDYSYIKDHDILFQKLRFFDTYFKAWDIVFYLDASATVYGDLNRFKTACEPTGFIYAHSDCYPTYKWTLERQFALEFLSEEQKQSFLHKFKIFDEKGLGRDYFQSTIFIYDTKILNDSTLPELIDMIKEYPICTRADQGILNLYFNALHTLWKQIPFADEQGYLYDFLRRFKNRNEDYVVLKRNLY
jgi:hypothetical protein